MNFFTFWGTNCSKQSAWKVRQCIRGALSVWCWKEGILSHATLVCGNKGAAQGRARSFFLSCFFHSNPISTNSKLNKVAMIAGEHAPRPPEPCGTWLVFHYCWNAPPPPLYARIPRVVSMNIQHASTDASGCHFFTQTNSVTHFCFIHTSVSGTILSESPSAALCHTATACNGVLV